jgi:hypothetical protein
MIGLFCWPKWPQNSQSVRYGTIHQLEQFRALLLHAWASEMPIKRGLVLPPLVSDECPGCANDLMKFLVDASRIVARRSNNARQERLHFGFRADL